MSSPAFETATQPLRIAAKDEIARDILRFELVRADGGDLKEFTAGAHVSLRTPNGLIRKYSLCNDPQERDRYAIAVKREDPGTGGSLSFTRDAKVGDEVEVGEPRNDFPLAGNITNHLFIAGGIGIT
jgi:phthalate 4,5-dioxygenase reductase subunit